jgi:hypothetical protein
LQPVVLGGSGTETSPFGWLLRRFPPRIPALSGGALRGQRQLPGEAPTPGFHPRGIGGRDVQGEAPAAASHAWRSIASGKINGEGLLPLMARFCPREAPLLFPLGANLAKWRPFGDAESLLGNGQNLALPKEKRRVAGKRPISKTRGASPAAVRGRLGEHAGWAWCARPSRGGVGGGWHWA